MGYYLYATACKKAAKESQILTHLPSRTLPMTYDWDRNYDPCQLIRTMRDLFEPYLARVALISIIGVFEGALRNFLERLCATGMLSGQPPGSYKKKLEWTFPIALQSTYGGIAMTSRIPDLCLHVDHARRIRNLWMHNNGLFDDGYADAIPVGDRPPIIDPSFAQFCKCKRKRIPVVLNPDAFLTMSRSHIGLLHHLHHSQQRIYFGQKRSYSYKALKKPIEWHKLLIGK